MLRLRSNLVPIALAGMLVVFLAGCGSSSGGTSSEPGSTGAREEGGHGQLPPGKIRRSAPSSADKEIPTRFGRTVSLPYRSTVLYATAVAVTDPIGGRTARHADGRVIGVVVGIRNIGTSRWTGSPAALSRLAVSSADKPQRVVRSYGASSGPCPTPLIKSRAPVSSGRRSLPGGRTTFACVRFLVPKGENAILFKFATQASDYTPAGAADGGLYGVWALPGTLVDRCRYEPGPVKGHCAGRENDE
jgi:hypothetical protein